MSSLLGLAFFVIGVVAKLGRQRLPHPSTRGAGRSAGNNLNPNPNPNPEQRASCLRDPAVEHFRQGGGEGLTRRYSSFEDFASEQSAKRRSNETLGVPIVTSTDGPKAARSLPAAIIIGVQVRVAPASWFSVSSPECVISSLLSVVERFVRSTALSTAACGCGKVFFM